MSNEAILLTLGQAPQPLSKEQIRARLNVEMTSDQVSKALYNLWKRERITRLTSKDGIYTYRLADPKGEELSDESLPAGATMLSITPTPTRLTEAKAQLVRALREEMMPQPLPALYYETMVATAEPTTPPNGGTPNSAPTEIPPPTPPMNGGAIPAEPELGASNLILPDDDEDLPFSSNPQFEADPVLLELARGIQGKSIRNATVHVRRLRALAIWNSIPQSVGQWLCDLATEIEQQAV